MKIFHDRIPIPVKPALWIVLAWFLTACAPQNMFVLMPDTEGQIGAITVRNDRGSRTIDRAGHGVAVAGKEEVPSAPAPVSEEKIQEWFGKAITAAPTPPENFILFFHSGTAELTPKSRAQIPEILTAVENRDSRDISVVGHSDRAGSEELNWALSLERAAAVEGILKASGVPTDHISTTSHGEGNPLIPTEDDVAEPRNRRVEVTVR
ncbi:MAG: OmpA family protein [Desulfococcaceae bacterium]